MCSKSFSTIIYHTQRITGFSSSVFAGFSQGKFCVLWIELLCVIDLLIVTGPHHIIDKKNKVQESFVIAQTLTKLSLHHLMLYIT